MIAIYSDVAGDRPTRPCAVKGPERRLRSPAIGEKIRARSRCGGWRPSSYLRTEFKTLFVALATCIVSACTSWQAQENTLNQISTLEQMRYSQLLQNLANEIDREDSLPSLAVTSSGTATASNTGTVLANLMNYPLNFGHNTKTLSPSLSAQWQNNWTISPIADPQDLTNLRALYGLLYRTDAQIIQIIYNTLKFYTPPGKRITDWVAQQMPQCGMIWNPEKKEYVIKIQLT